MMHFFFPPECKCRQERCRKMCVARKGKGLWAGLERRRTRRRRRRTRRRKRIRRMRIHAGKCGASAPR
jgi:hypothetical protein